MPTIDSPFDAPLGKDTVSQTPSGDGGMGAVPGPSGDYPFVQTYPLPTTAITTDSPFEETVVTSINTVSSADPGGSAPMESPFKDGLAK